MLKIYIQYKCSNIYLHCIKECFQRKLKKWKKYFRKPLQTLKRVVRKLNSKKKQ